MIKYDYVIKRNEQDEIRTYTPALPKTLDDLCLIEGPNSSGKSTLLHIIALALNGKENPGVCKALKQKMHRLLESEHQETTFDVILKNEHANITIQAEKSSPNSSKIDLWEIENGIKHRLSSDLFDQKYKLIYDIPNDPTTRLKDLTHDLLEKHHQIGRKLNNFRLSIRDLLNEINNARDPLRLTKVEDIISKSENELLKLKKSIKIDKTFLKKFEQYTYSKLYSKHIYLEKDISSRITDLQKRKKTVKREKKSKDKKLALLQTQARAEAMKIIDSRNEVCHSISEILESSPIIDSFSNLNIQNCLFMPDQNNLLTKRIHHLKRDLLDLRAELSKNDDIEKANFYQELLLVLGGHSSLDIEIPGLERRVSDLIDILQSSLRDLVPKKHKLESLDKCLEHLNLMEKSYNHFVAEYLPRINNVLPHIGSDTDEFENAIYHQEEMLADLEERKSFHQKHILKYRDLCIQAGLKEELIIDFLTQQEHNEELQLFSGYSEEAFISQHLKLESRYNKKAENILQLESKLSRLTQEKQDILRKKPHIYQDDKQSIALLYDKIESLEKKIKITCVDRLKTLSKITDPSILNEEEIDFFDNVAHYLGLKVGTVRHIESEFEVDKIDMIMGVIHTVSGKRINLLDMGTGQSQGAYLQGLLTSDDNRKVIALIDEVAMMDTKTITPVINKMRNMYLSGKLLAGIIVQRSDDLSASGLLEEGKNAK